MARVGSKEGRALMAPVHGKEGRQTEAQRQRFHIMLDFMEEQTVHTSKLLAEHLGEGASLYIRAVLARKKAQQTIDTLMEKYT